MVKSIRAGSRMRRITLLLFVICAWLPGCGKSDDSVLQEQVQLLNQTAELLNKITDEARAKAAEADFKKIKERADEIDKIVRSWTKEKKESLAKIHNLHETAQKVEAALQKANPAAVDLVRKYLK
jgi:predicted helicase